MIYLTETFHRFSPSVFVVFFGYQHILKVNGHIGRKSVVYIHTPTQSQHHQAAHWVPLNILV